MNLSILVLVLFCGCSIIHGERLVMHVLTSREVHRLLRESNRLDVIPHKHVLKQGLAMLDEEPRASSNDRLGKVFNIFGGGSSSSGGYSEVCFTSGTRIARQASPTNSNTVTTTSCYTPPYTGTQVHTPTTTTVDSARSTPSAPTSGSSPTTFPTPDSTGSTTSGCITYSPSTSFSPSTSTNPGTIPSAPTTPTPTSTGITTGTGTVPSEPPSSNDSVKCVSLGKPKKYYSSN